MKLVLASASPRRRELLTQVGLSFDVVPADIDESVQPGEAPRVYVERLARAKAASVHQRHPDSLALAADTSVVVDDDILGKPGASLEAGRAMLQRLSGREHLVITAVAVAGERVSSVVVETTVRFRALSGPEIAWYAHTHEGQDKAGGYAVQGKAGAFVVALNGSPSNVIGLPLAETLALLEGAGVALPWSPPVIDAAALATNFAAVEARMAQACLRAQRPRADVTLLAVSKLHPPQAIRAAYALGQRHFGENYAQELRDKSAALAELAGIRWHAIGPLQVKNAKYVAKAAHVFHALTDLEVAQELSRRRTGAALACLVEVNLAQEGSKAGVAPEAAEALVTAARGLPGLEVVGLTAMPPLTEDAEASRPHFQRLAAMARALGLRELSMGTTADFEVAIEEGATVVRVGTALFGTREAA